MSDEEKNLVPKKKIRPRMPTSRHYAMAYMFILGSSPKEIAQKMQITQERARVVINTPYMRALIEKVRMGAYTKDVQKRIDDLVPKAIDVAEEIMADENVKPAIRSETAFRFMDRGLGKPVQQVEVKGSLIRDLIKELQSVDSKKSIDNAVSSANNGAVDAQYSEVPAEREAQEIQETDEMDDWVKENFK